MKKMQFFMCALLAGAMMFTACEKKGGNGEIDIPEEPEVVVEEAPVLVAPGAGQVTIAVRVPDNTKFGVALIGDMNSWNNDEAAKNFKMTPVKGTKTWHSITVAYEASQTFKMLPIMKKADGTEYTTWSVEWNGCSLLDADAFSKDNLKMADITDGSVVYYEINHWSADPSVVFAAAGTYKFVFTPQEGDEIPAGDMTFTGNFAESSWDQSTRVMTANGGSYEWEGEIGENFSCKVFVRDAEGAVIWPNEADNFVVTVESVKEGVVAFDCFTFKPAEEEQPAE